MNRRRRFLRSLFFISGAIVGALTMVVYLSGRAPTSASAVPMAPLPGAWRSPDEQRQIDVYKRANDAVVFITTVSLELDPNEMFFSMKPREGTGSGCIVDLQRGLIVTNLHVVKDAQQIEITFANGETAPAKRLGVDEETDIAVLQVAAIPNGTTPLSFADSSRLEVGQRVLAIGNPFGLNRTLTGGIISSLDRTVRVSERRSMRGLVQTDAAINPGNSGGALLDMNGDLIGINSAILSSSGDSAGIGFAVPANQIKRILPDLVAKGRVLRPRIGWALLDTNQGPFVLSVLENSPASESGVQPVLRRVERAFLQGVVRDFSRADLIVSVNGAPVNSADQIEDLVKSQAGDAPIAFGIRRGGLTGPERVVKITPVLR